MADIFISYKREDQEEHGRVAPIAEALRAEGYDVFYDVYVPPGSSWEAVLQEKMNLARCVIVLWSQVSVTSDWVKEEAEMAKADGKLIPVFLDAVAPPFGFARIEGANLANWDGDLQHQEWKNLVAAVKARIGQGDGPTAPGVTRVAYTPSKQVEITKSAPPSGSSGGGGVGKWLGGAVAILAISAAGFFGWQTWQANEMARDRATDAAMDQAMTRGIDERAWRAASEADTVVAYERYLTERPTGAYRSEAIDRIEMLQAEAAEEAASRPADLSIGMFKPRVDSVSPGETFTVDLQVRNQGGTLAPGGAAGGYIVDFVLGRDTNAPVQLARFSDSWSEDAMLRDGRYLQTQPLAPSGATLSYPTMTIPEGWPAGRFQLCAVVDPSRKIEETDETNNVACHELFVARPPAAETGRTFDYDALRARRYRVGPVTISNLRLDPAPPRQMNQGQELTIQFDYRFDAGQEANIWMRPVIEGTTGRCSYGASGSPSLSGSGTGQQSFTLRGGGCAGFTLREIVMKVGDRSGTTDVTFPVYYEFRL